MERAADDMDKWELKKAKSIQKAATIKERAKQWEDVNVEGKEKKKSAFAVLAEGGEEGKNGRAWAGIGDEKMDEAAVQDDGKAAEKTTTSVAQPVEEDELL